MSDTALSHSGTRAQASPLRSASGADRAGFAVEIVRDAAGVAALSADWLALEAECGGASLFQSLGWCAAVMDFAGARHGARFEPVIAVLRAGKRVRAILPLERASSRLRSALVPLGDSFGQYADVLIAPGLEAGPILAELIAKMRRTAPSDMITFLKVREGSRLAQALPNTALKTGSEQTAPSVPLAEWPDFEAYFASIKAKTRKNMRNTRNRLEREGALSHCVAETDEEVSGIVARTLEGRAERLKDQGLTSRAFATADFKDFCQSLVGRPGLSLLAMSLRHKGEPLAEQWGFIHGGRYYAYVASRDFSHSEESPGRLHLKEVIETCFARGLATCDLLVPAMPYKLTWAKDLTPVHDYALPLSVRGWIGIYLWDRTLRPAAKRAVLAMPRPVRSMVMKLAGRG